MVAFFVYLCLIFISSSSDKTTITISPSINIEFLFGHAWALFFIKSTPSGDNASIETLL